MTEREYSDSEWHAAQAAEGWEIHRKASWPWRVWGVRHVRAVWHAYRSDRDAREWAATGVGTGYTPPYDRWMIYAIARGWA